MEDMPTLKSLTTGKKTLRDAILPINSIYLNKKGKIFDPQQGVNDLKQ